MINPSAEPLLALARFFACLAGINLIALGAPLGARLAVGFTLDDRERRQMTSVAVLLWLAGAVVVCLLPGMLFPGLCAAAVSLLSLLISLRFRLVPGKPGLKALVALVSPLGRLIIAQLVYGLGGALLALLFEPLAVPGYALGLLTLLLMRLGYDEKDARQSTRCTWLALMVSVSTLLNVLLYPLNASMFRFLITLPIFACTLGFALGRQAHRMIDLLPATFSALALLLPAPHSALAAGALFAAFIFLMRKALYEAALPVRARFIRFRARRR